MHEALCGMKIKINKLKETLKNLFLKGLFSKEVLAPSSQFTERLGNQVFFPFCYRIFITDTWLGVSLPVPDVTT